MLLWKEGWKGYRRCGKRWERVQEMGETVETVLGFLDGIQVHSSFHIDVKELE
jgi:hypothetical protein